MTSQHSQIQARPAVARASRDAGQRSGPWWKYGHMWLVVGGPLVVVVASFVTLHLALSTADPVYSDQQPSAEDVSARANRTNSDLAPAMQARNHAATGGVNERAVERRQDDGQGSPASAKQP